MWKHNGIIFAKNHVYVSKSKKIKKYKKQKLIENLLKKTLI
jgi:hypothetical protein